jgi:anti-sigma factor RsiW
MTHEVIVHLLDDYVTGELSDDARAPVAEHVAACAICSAEVASLKGILERAADLPRSIDPPAEAWANIRSSILREESAAKSHLASGRKRLWRHPWMAAVAAGIVVAILSSTTTAWYLNRTHRAGVSASAATPTGNTGQATIAQFTLEENSYLRTVAALQDVLDQQEAVLAPETVAQLKASLRTIDEAIYEARNALARDPSNRVLVEMLTASYKQKVDLLRRSTEITRGT